mgnify:CR=1 FL=1
MFPVMKLKIVTWNINKAAYTREKLWSYLEKLDFDIGLFQEVYMIPYKIRKDYYTIHGEMNAILIKKDLTKIRKEDVLFESPEFDVIADFYVSAKIKSDDKEIVLISVYNYMGPNEEEFSMFLDALFNYIQNNREREIIVIGGDFNMDENFKGYLKGWGLLAERMKKKLYQLNFYEALSHKFGSEAFTFITPKKKIPYQLDYLFIPKRIKVQEVEVGNENEIINQKPRLSDHLPIIATIEL